MTLSDSQCQTILREYDELRQLHRDIQRQRKEEVYSLLPDLEEIDQQLVQGSMQAAKQALQGNPSLLDDLEVKNRALIAQKAALLRQAGFPEDYLELPYRCPLCHDTGTYQHAPCKCFRHAVISRFYLDDHRRALLERENFSTFQFGYYSKDSIDESTGLSYYEIAKRAYHKALDFVERFASCQGESMIIRGEIGVGKTFLANCIAKALIDRNVSVLYATATQLFGCFEQARSFGNHSKSHDAERFLQLAGECDLLIIDDLGTEPSTSYTNSQFFSCLEQRLLRNAPILITTNLSLPEIQEHYTERISSRMIHFKYIRIVGSDIRIRKIMQGNPADNSASL